MIHSDESSIPLLLLPVTYLLVLPVTYSHTNFVYPFTLRVRYTLSDESNGYKLSDDSSTPFYSTSNGFLLYV